MIGSNENQINKMKVEIEIVLTSGAAYKGWVFVKAEERVSDLLNDHREFLPICLEDETIKFVQKTTIANVIQIGDARQESRKDNTWGKPTTGFRTGEMSPDEAILILNLEGGFTSEDVVQAHRTIMSKVHPDRGGSNYMASKVNIAKSLLLKVARAQKEEQERAAANGADGSSGADTRT